MQTFAGVKSGSFPAPDHEYPSHLELRLTVTDAGGLTDTKTLQLDPRTVELSFQSSPSGLQLTFGGSSSTTPFTRTVIEGSTNSVSAPTPQTLGGTDYVWASWSDGGAQSHNIVANAAATYTAAYQAVATGPAGLAAAFSFDEGLGASAADASGNGNTGAVGTASWIASGKFGNALLFNGTNARVTVADSPSLDLTTAMTLEAWVYPTGGAGQWRDVIYKGPDDIYYLESHTSNGPPATGGTFANPLFGTAVPPLNTWSHLAATYDGTTLRLYVNGVQVASRAQTGPIATSAGALTIGGDALYGQHFSGRIDEVRIYGTALSASEIQTDMNTPIGTPGPDTQPPTAPTGLTATAVSPSQINLAWTASTDNVAVTGYRVERCQGAGCSNFVQVATPTATSFSDSGRAAATSYSYRVRAADAAGNLSGYSSVQSATTPAAPDTQPPTAPSGLTATAVSASQINLAWTASTDNVAVTGYRLERCQGAGCSNFVQVATPTTTSFNDSGRAAATSYSYRVRAADAAGNLSGYSSVQSATTPAAGSALVAAYGFDEGLGGSVGDASGSGNGGSIGSATWAGVGRFGNALSFNGSGARVTVSDSASLDLTTAMTLEAWVFPTAGGGWRDVIYKGPDDIYYLESSTASAPNPPGVGGTFASPLYGSSALPLNVWSHLAATYDGQTLRLYVNGVQVASRVVLTPIETSTGALTIGGDALYGQYFAGRIDEVRIYNTALSASQIQTDMNTPVGSGP